MRKFAVFIAVLFSLCSVVVSSGAFAGTQKKVSGVLQAYWFPQWTDEGQAKPPLMMMRFFETDTQKGKVYYLYDVKDKAGVKDYFDATKMEKFIKSNFKNTPEEFFKFKEGHTEEAGVLAISDKMIIADCDNKKNYAKFESFTPVAANSYDIKKMELNSGCDPEPYSVMFTVKDELKNVFLKTKPSESSENVVKNPVSQPLVKIKTIDSQWVYVALYDASQPDSRSKIKGYLNIKDLNVVN